MRAALVLRAMVCILVASSASAWTHQRDTQLRLLFDEGQESHPKSAVVAIPVTETIVGEVAGLLSFEGTYITLFQDSDDSRNGKGKVIMRITVFRDDKVVWRKKRKDRIKDD